MSHINHASQVFELLQLLEANRNRIREARQQEIAVAQAKQKKSMRASLDRDMEYLDDCQTILESLKWIYEKFGEGEYTDIPGLCKVATLEEIEAKGHSLTPGAYVGVAPTEDDGVDFHQRMTEIHKELRSLQEESNRLMETISKNWEEMGL